MWNPQTMEVMPGFWPPKVSRFWTAALEPLRKYYLRRFYQISSVEIHGAELLGKVGKGDGLLIAPNHSHDSDPHVMMEVGRQLGRPFYFMAAWQVFLAHRGIDGWVMQRFGAFSVDREGCDRRAIRQAVELLTTGNALVVFPEGEIYHTNERLTPLREGVAFMAVTAQRDLEKENAGRRIWVAPTCIRYRYETDVMPQLQESVAQMERRFMLKPRVGTSLSERIVRLGEVLLTIKEKERLGHSSENEGDLPTRIGKLIERILERIEQEQLGKIIADTVPVRVKNLRRHVLEKTCEESATDDIRQKGQAALDELHLVLQLYSYPGDYVSASPTVERMAETIEKFEEDISGTSSPKGKRRAIVTFGEPIDVKATAGGRPRAASVELTGKLETAIRGLMETPMPVAEV
jgi:1-acyl-sn-glycerol-3-phosphate acyltransferase